MCSSDLEQLWTRFRTAADLFFERFHHRHELALAGKVAEREAMVVEMEAIALAEAAIENLADKVQTLRTTWNRAVPIPSPDFRVIADRWQKALATVIQRWPDAFKGTDVDPTATVQRMEKIVAKLDALLTQLTSTADEPAKPNLSPTAIYNQLSAAGYPGDECRWSAARTDGWPAGLRHGIGAVQGFRAPDGYVYGVRQQHVHLEPLHPIWRQ